MGWSCRAEAARVMERWTETCRKLNNTSNTFEHNGQRYFWETSNREWADGSITGTVFHMLSDSMARRAGTFRISGEGNIERAPKFMLTALKEAT